MGVPLLCSLHQDDSSQVVAKQEAKEATDKRGEEAAAAEGSCMSLLSRTFCGANYSCIVAERKIKELHKLRLRCILVFPSLIKCNVDGRGSNYISFKIL